MKLVSDIAGGAGRPGRQARAVQRFTRRQPRAVGAAGKAPDADGLAPERRRAAGGTRGPGELPHGRRGTAVRAWAAQPSPASRTVPRAARRVRVGARRAARSAVCAGEQRVQRAGRVLGEQASGPAWT